MSVTHHGGQCTSTPRLPADTQVRGLGRPVEERGAPGTVPSMARWLGIDVP